MIRLRYGVIEIIEQVRPATRVLDQRQRTRDGRDREARVQFSAARLRRIAIEPDQQELARTDESAGGERPLREIRVVVRQKNPAEIEVRVGSVVKFDPRMMVAEAVGGAAQVVWQNLVQPKFRHGGQVAENRIDGPGSGSFYGRGRIGAHRRPVPDVFAALREIDQLE